MTRPAWMPSRARLAMRAALLAWLAFLAVLLQACGGGNADDDEPLRTTAPSQGQITPKVCE